MENRHKCKTEQELYGGSEGGVAADAAMDPEMRVEHDIAILSI